MVEDGRMDGYPHLAATLVGAFCTVYLGEVKFHLLILPHTFCDHTRSAPQPFSLLVFPNGLLFPAGVPGIEIRIGFLGESVR